MINKRWQQWWAIGALLAWPLVAAAQSVNIAAVVNDDVVTSTALNARRDLVMTTNEVALTAENQKRMTPRILQALIDETLQLQEAKRLSIAVSDAEIDKAIAALEESRQQAPGTLLAGIRSQGLSERALRDQVRAEVAWGKVIQRKLRRNVTISEDELARAQQAQAADPGINELRIAALSIPMRTAKEEASATALAKSIGDALRAGTPLSQLAVTYAKQDIDITPPKWIAEETLQPALQQAMRTLNPGDVTPPLRTPKSYQLIQLIDRRLTKPLADDTEVVLKDITLAAPFNPDKAALQNFREQTEIARTNPGTCMEAQLGASGTGATVGFKRSLVGALPAEVKSVLNHLAVGDISEPMLSNKAITLIMLCEKIEPATTGSDSNKKLRNQLFREKLELEAQKLLRDLRRDAFIDVKGGDVGT